MKFYLIKQYFCYKIALPTRENSMKKKEKNAPKKYNVSFARRLTRWVMLVLFVMMSALSYLIYETIKSMVVYFSANTFHTSMQASAQLISNAMQDVSDAVRNNIYDVEQSLSHDNLDDNVDAFYETVVRIKALNPGVRNWDIRPVESLRNEEWAREVVAADSAGWSKPFFDTSDGKTPVVAYLHPVHDRNGQVKFFFIADISLEFMAEATEEMDSVFQQNLALLSSLTTTAFCSYVIQRDGTFMTHTERRRILKGKLYDHIKDYDEPGAARETIEQMKKGGHSDDEAGRLLRVNRVKTFLFYVPIENCDWMLAVCVPAFTLDLFGMVAGVMMLMVILLLLIVTFFVCHLTIKRAAKPLKQLAAAADEVAGGQFDAPLPSIKSRDEVHLLRDSFENMQHSLTAYVEELKSATPAKASMESELKIAHDIQMSMLPKTYPAFPDRTDLDIYGYVVPAKAVGGDLFDFFIHDEKLIFCIGDVSGKGVPASLFMAVTRFLFRNIAIYTQEPNHIAEALNEALSINNDTEMFVTIFLGVLDLATGHLSYSNAGHNPPLLIGEGGVTPLRCDANIPVGVMPGFRFTTQETQLQPGDTIFLYTDGLSEAEDTRLQQFGIERILQVANASSNQPQPLIETMTSSVKQFIGEAEQSDDLTMLAVKYQKAK